MSLLLNAVFHHSLMMIPQREIPGTVPRAYVMRHPVSGSVEVNVQDFSSFFFGAILMIFCDPTVGLVVTMPEPRMPWRCGTRHCCRSVLGPLSVARAESKNRDYLTDENSDATDRRQRRNRRFELSFEQEEEESSSSQYDGDAQYEHIIDDRVLM